MNLRPALASLLLPMVFALPLPARAQQAPLTGQMLAPAVPAPAPTPAPPANAADTDGGTAGQVGDVTRRLLALQVAGTQAGKALPIPGAEASASYARYLKSFEHPIPAFFESTVPNAAGSGMAGAGSGAQ